jgi:drug/metabolite transporter (DMT)-like permease
MRGVSMVPGVVVGYLLAGGAVAFWAAPFSLAIGQAGLVLAHAATISVSAVLLALGPRYITSAEVGLLVLLESALAPLLVWAAIGENPGPHAILGGGIVLGALALSNVVVLRRRWRRTGAARRDMP